VTDIVREHAKNGRIRLPINNITMGGDPIPGHRKRIVMDYSFRGGEQATIEVPEKVEMKIG